MEDGLRNTSSLILARGVPQRETSIIIWCFRGDLGASYSKPSRKEAP